MSISWGTQYPKLKTNLRLAINRLKLMGKKKTEMAMKARTEIADYILAHKEDRARIRVEHIIREDFLVEAYELLEMYCDLLLARFGLIEQMKTLDDGIAEAVISILWAAPRIATDIAEFKTISDQLTHKYGKPFAEAARANQLEYPAKVAPKLIAKLSANAPPKLLVEKYMIEIATAAGVPFTPDPDVIRDDEILQAEKMLIDFKQQGEGGVPVSHDGLYGWNLPGGPPPPGSGFGHPGGGGGHFGNTGGHLRPGIPLGIGSGYIGGERNDNSFPPPCDAPPPPPPPHNNGGDGGKQTGGNIYEVPGRLPHPHYDQIPSPKPPYDGFGSGFSTPCQTEYDYATISENSDKRVPGAGGYQNPSVYNPQQSAGVIQLPQIGPNGLPIMPGGGGNTVGAGGNTVGAGGNYPILSQRVSFGLF